MASMSMRMQNVPLSMGAMAAGHSQPYLSHSLPTGMTVIIIAMDTASRTP